MSVYSKKGWDIVSDIIRYVGYHPGLINEIETDQFHLDIAIIMDEMYNGKTFKQAVRAYKAQDDEGDNASWIDEILANLNIVL